jgi:hypothetical protein
MDWGWEIVNALLDMTTKKPKANMAAIPSFCLSFSWSFMTMDMGRQMIMASENMLTKGLVVSRMECE